PGASRACWLTSRYTVQPFRPCWPVGLWLRLSSLNTVPWMVLGTVRSSSSSRRRRVTERRFFLVRSREVCGDWRARPCFQERSRDENDIVRAFQVNVRSAGFMGRTSNPGAQTERRGDAGPVRVCLRRTRTGRFFLNHRDTEAQRRQIRWFSLGLGASVVQFSFFSSPRRVEWRYRPVLPNA